MVFGTTPPENGHFKGHDSSSSWIMHSFISECVPLHCIGVPDLGLGLARRHTATATMDPVASTAAAANDGGGGDAGMDDRPTHTQAIIIGTIAYYLGKKADEYHSHRWTVYVRGPDGEDLTHVLESVTFKLHPSFEESERTLGEPPFEVTETGWGEFDVGVTLTFKEDARAGGGGKPMTIETTTPLKLFPSAEEIARYGPQTTKKPLIKERYEELVFVGCEDGFYKRMAKASSRKKAPASEHDGAWASFKDKDELKAIYAARKVTEERIEVLKQQLEVLESIDANA